MTDDDKKSKYKVREELEVLQSIENLNTFIWNNKTSIRHTGNIIKMKEFQEKQINNGNFNSHKKLDQSLISTENYLRNREMKNYFSKVSLKKIQFMGKDKTQLERIKNFNKKNMNGRKKTETFELI